MRLDQHFSYIRDLENTMTGMAMQCSLTGLDVNAITALNTGTRSARTGRSRTSPSCRWTWSGSRSPAT